MNACTATLLTHSSVQFDYPACVRALAAAAGDEEPRVAAAALEAFALLYARLGALLQGMLTAVGADDGVKRRVAERGRATPRLGLPTLDSQGLVQHQVGGKEEVGGMRMPQHVAGRKGTNRSPSAACTHPFSLPLTCRLMPARQALRGPSRQQQRLQPASLLPCRRSCCPLCPA